MSSLSRRRCFCWRESDSVRSVSYTHLDAQISRIFPVREGIKVDLRLEAFNVLNHPSFSNPSSSGPAGSSFGEISNTTIGARVFQGGFKVIF